MQKIFILLILLNSVILTAQSDYFDHFKITPNNRSSFLKDGLILSGGVQRQIRFEKIAMQKEQPKELPKIEGLDYQAVLNAGLNSFIFQNKYYKDLSYYSLFGWGDFSAINKGLLDVANTTFFPNQKLLKQLYAYYKPEYQKAFKILSRTEQALYLSKLEIAEHYVKFVLKQKNPSKYKAWLEKNQLKDDFYITDFLARRVNKGQWSIKDCRYWIKRVAKDFKPLLKADLLSNQYYFIEALDSNSYIVMDHHNNFYITDSNYQLCLRERYQSLFIKDNEIKGYKWGERKELQVYPSQYNEKANQFFIINDSLYIYYLGKDIFEYVKTGTDSDLQVEQINEKNCDPPKKRAFWRIVNYKNNTVFRAFVTAVDFGYLVDQPFLTYQQISKHNDTAAIIDAESETFIAKIFAGKYEIPVYLDFDPKTYEEIYRYSIYSVRFEEKLIGLYFHPEKGGTVLVDLIQQKLIFNENELEVAYDKGVFIFKN